MSAASIHATAIIDPGATIGEGTRVWHWVHVCGGAVIGRGCSLGQNGFVGNRVRIGDNVKIQNNVSVYDNVTLENDVFCGPSMVFTNVYNPRAAVSRKDEYRDTIVRRGATLGANCTIGRRPHRRRERQTSSGAAGPSDDGQPGRRRHRTSPRRSGPAPADPQHRGQRVL